MINADTTVPSVRASARELLGYRHLLFMLTWRDIRIRYKQSIMGFLWALLMPMLIVGSGMLIRQAYSFVSGAPITLAEVVGVSVKALPWAFFVGAIKFGTTSLTSNQNLVTKIYFPREVFPIAAVIAHLFDFAVALPVVVIGLALAGVGASQALVWVPLLLVLLILLTTGFAILLACGNLFFRDVKYIVDAVLTYGVFFTPVFYDVEMLGRWGWLVLLNPVAPVLEGLRAVVVLHAAPDAAWLLWSTAWAVAGSVLAWRIFDRAEYRFAESI